mgnify:CR=1 FL=1
MNELEFMDRRMVERNIRKGKLTQKEFQEYLGKLPDREENAEEVEYDEELLKATSREGRTMRSSKEQDEMLD